MDTRLTQQGIVRLNAGEILRLRDAAGRHLGVVDGAVWLTQEDDPTDYVVASGASFRFSRNKLALALALRGSASVVLEDGLTPSVPAEHPVLATTRRAWRLGIERNPERSQFELQLDRAAVNSVEYELAVRRKRAAAIANALRGFARRLSDLWKTLVSTYATLLQRQRTMAELRALNDHTLKDIGLHRDQIESLSAILAARTSDGA